MKSLVREAGVDDLARHRVGERDVAADVEAQPHVGPLRRTLVRRGSITYEPRAVAGFPSAGGGTRSDASRGRSIPTGGRRPSPRPRGRSSCRHPHRTPSPDRRRWGVSGPVAAVDVVGAERDVGRASAPRKFTSLVDFEQLKMPSASGPRASMLRRKPSAAQSSAASHEAGRSTPSTRTRGSVRRGYDRGERPIVMTPSLLRGDSIRRMIATDGAPRAHHSTRARRGRVRGP